MKVKTIISMIAMFILMSAAFTAFASENPCIFLAPQSMNEYNEIVVPVYIKNVPTDNNGLCGIEFKLMYDTEQFVIKTDESSRPILSTNDSMLIRNTDAINISKDSNIVSISCINFGEDTVLRDGPLFSFTLIPKSPDELWNSDNYYPLRFLPNSVNLVTMDKKNMSLAGVSAEGIDTYVGGYNVFPTFEPPEIDGMIEFKMGSSVFLVNGEEKQTDTVIYEKDGEIMVPIRFVGEELGMEVGYDSTTATVSVYYPYMSMYVTLTDGLIYINARQRDDLIKAELKDNRTFIGLSVVEEMLTDMVNIEKYETGIKLNFNKN